MKRLFGVLIFTLLLGSLGACSSDDSTTVTNTISAADVNDREETILSTSTNESFLFDYHNTDYDEVMVWVEKYESGELVDDQLGFVTTQASEEGSIIVATAINDNDGEQTFLIGIGDEGGTSSASILDDNLGDAEHLSKVFGELPEDQILDNGEIVLADMAYINDDFGTSSISNQFYEDPEAHMDELKEYDIVYLFKAEFTEE